jgi:hypothetical protein
VVNQVCPNDSRDNAPEHRNAKKEADGKSPVRQAIVNQEVRDAEAAHADADAEGELSREAGFAQAALEHECDGERGMRSGKRVVGLEATGPAPVVGGMNVPQPSVPHAPVQEPRPSVHGHGYEDGHRDPHAHPTPAGPDK